MTTTETEIASEFTGPKIARAIAKFVVKHSVAFTVGSAIAQNIEVEKTHQRAEIFIGGYLLGAIAADAGWNVVEQRADSIATSFKKVRAELDAAQAKKEDTTSTDL